MRPLLISLSLFALCLASCKSKSDSPKEKITSVTELQSKARKNSLTDSTIDCREVGNLLIDPKEADKMIKLFGKHYKGALKDLADSVWIDSCVIAGFAKYFNANNTYDGARVYSGVNNSSKTSTIMLCVTQPGSGSRPVDRHKDVLSANISLSSFSCNTEFKNFNLHPDTFKVMRDKFGKDFRREGSAHKIDSLSVSVWVSNCVFTVLSDLFATYPNVYDGATVYFAAYDEKKPSSRRGQQYQYQSTIIIVPTKPDRGKHKPDWDILTKTVLYQKFVPFDGFNHGELCPDVCNTD